MGELGLEGKGVIVTGAAGGLGRAFALGFAKAGAKVAVADLDSAGARETAAMIEKARGEAIALHVDVSEPRLAERLAQLSRNGCVHPTGHARDHPTTGGLNRLDDPARLLRPVRDRPRL